MKRLFTCLITLGIVVTVQAKKWTVDEVKSIIKKVSPLARYDYMSDHSDGKRYLDGKQNDEGTLIVNDYKRSRITGGVTISLDKPFVSDIRINYEKYFYGHDGIPKV